VAEPTVYRHFPSKDALFAALAATQFEHVPNTLGARTADELALALPTVFRRALDHEPLLRWALVNSPRLASRSGRTRRLAVLHHLLRDARPDDVNHVVRLLMLLTSPLAALYWKDELGLPAESAAETAAWAIRAIASLGAPTDSE
jgi:AcrR family transcriptional regulator